MATCSWCEEEFNASPVNILNSHGVFCDWSCYGAWQIAQSEDERWLSEVKEAVKAVRKDSGNDRRAAVLATREKVEK